MSSVNENIANATDRISDQGPGVPSQPNPMNPARKQTCSVFAIFAFVMGVLFALAALHAIFFEGQNTFNSVFWLAISIFVAHWGYTRNEKVKNGEVPPIIGGWY